MDNVLNTIKKGLLIAAGTVFLIIGIVGVFLPFFPGTPFLILAAICFGAAAMP